MIIIIIMTCAARHAVTVLAICRARQSLHVMHCTASADAAARQWSHDASSHVCACVCVTTLVR